MKLLKLTCLDYVHLALKEADAQVDRTWFEMARIRFLESLGQDGLAGARDWILASLQIDFVAETFYGTDVIASITEANIGNSSLTVVCEMTQGDQGHSQG